MSPSPSQTDVQVFRPYRGSKVLLYVFAIIIPPVSVYLLRGFTIDLLINVLLFIFGHILAIVHAIYIITTDAEFHGEKFGSSRSRHTPSPDEFGASMPESDTRIYMTSHTAGDINPLWSGRRYLDSHDGSGLPVDSPQASSIPADSHDYGKGLSGKQSVYEGKESLRQIKEEPVQGERKA